MPRRSTHYYTSENTHLTTEQLYFYYYCKYSGKHVITISVNIKTLPKRNIDGSFILDKKKYCIEFYTKGKFIYFFLHETYK